MSEDIAVVKPYYLVEEAYEMGHDRFKDLSGEESEDFDFAPFTDSHIYANAVLPKLRAMAGFADRHGGTYTENRKVAAVKPGCEEDEPAEAELIDADTVFSELVDAFRTGAYDGVEGTYDPDIVKW